MGFSEFDEAYEDDVSRHADEERKLGEAILHAPIRALKPKPAVSIDEGASIGEAVQLLIDRHIGALVVTGDDGGIVGIFTERDVLRRVARSGIDTSRPVKDVMTHEPETLRLEDGIAFALNRMVVHGYRHVPILDAASGQATILSVRDVVSFIVSMMPSRVINLPPEPGLEARAPHGG
jgi:CBS domain-containing protein